MKKAKLWMASFLLMGFLFLSNTAINAAGCTQSHIDCPEEPGLYLMCSGPVTNSTCYAGGCGAPVQIVTCKKSNNEQ